MTIGQFLAKWRADFHERHPVLSPEPLTQRALGKRLGCSQGRIGNIEAGISDVSRATFVEIAEELRIPEHLWTDALRLPVRDESEQGAA